MDDSDTFALQAEERPGPNPDGHVPDLRGYQREIKEALVVAYREGRRKPMVGSATGSGKTVTALDLLAGTIQKGKRGMFVCDRIALIDQTSKKADEWGIDHGVIQDEHWRANPRAPLQIASVQTIMGRGRWPDADLIVIDEAHTVYKIVRELLQNTKAFVVGLSATPFTKGLGQLYDPRVINVATMRRLIDDEKALVPLEWKVCEAPDMKNARPNSDGEWRIEDVTAAEYKIIGNVVADSIKEGAGELKAILFGPTVDYCVDQAKLFCQAGIPAMAYGYKTPPDQRKKILEAYERGEIRVLCSVDALAKGFDAPDVEMVIDAYQLRKSLSTFIQRLGRGLRLCERIGKTRCKFLDFAGNTRNFFPDFMEFYDNGVTTLDDAEKLDAKVRTGDDEAFEPAGCPACGFKPFIKTCMRCKYEKPVAPVESHGPGVLKTVTIGKRQAAKDPHDLFQQIVFYTRKNLRGKTAYVLEQYARCRYKDILQQEAPQEWRFAETMGVEPTPATLGKLKSLRIAYNKGKGNRPAVGSKIHGQGDLIN